MLSDLLNADAFLRGKDKQFLYKVLPFRADMGGHFVPACQDLLE